MNKISEVLSFTYLRRGKKLNDAVFDGCDNLCSDQIWKLTKQMEPGPVLLLFYKPVPDQIRTARPKQANSSYQEGAKWSRGVSDPTEHPAFTHLWKEFTGNYIAAKVF